MAQYSEEHVQGALPTVPSAIRSQSHMHIKRSIIMHFACAYSSAHTYAIYEEDVNELAERQRVPRGRKKKRMCIYLKYAQKMIEQELIILLGQKEKERFLKLKEK